MEDRELGINLIIDGTSYPLTIKASEEPSFRQAARIVNGYDVPSIIRFIPSSLSSICSFPWLFL